MRPWRRSWMRRWRRHQRRPRPRRPRARYRRPQLGHGNASGRTRGGEVARRLGFTRTMWWSTARIPSDQAARPTICTRGTRKRARSRRPSGHFEITRLCTEPLPHPECDLHDDLDGNFGVQVAAGGAGGAAIAEVRLRIRETPEGQQGFAVPQEAFSSLVRRCPALRDLSDEQLAGSAGPFSSVSLAVLRVLLHWARSGRLAFDQRRAQALHDALVALDADATAARVLPFLSAEGGEVGGGGTRAGSRAGASGGANAVSRTGASSAETLERVRREARPVEGSSPMKQHPVNGRQTGKNGAAFTPKAMRAILLTRRRTSRAASAAARPGSTSVVSAQPAPCAARSGQTNLVKFFGDGILKFFPGHRTDVGQKLPPAAGSSPPQGVAEQPSCAVPQSAAVLTQTAAVPQKAAAQPSTEAPSAPKGNLISFFGTNRRPPASPQQPRSQPTSASSGFAGDGAVDAATGLSTTVVASSPVVSVLATARAARAVASVPAPAAFSSVVAAPKTATAEVPASGEKVADLVAPAAVPSPSASKVGSRGRRTGGHPGSGGRGKGSSCRIAAEGVPTEAELAAAAAEGLTWL
mmetsp:Transcript_170374/g.541164  ORF Transcript_170374/g.541164 Transcript_170374/m.541164 type:complete len:581 (+) Transcript_170374:1166-2908(+)